MNLVPIIQGNDFNHTVDLFFLRRLLFFSILFRSNRSKNIFFPKNKVKSQHFPNIFLPKSCIRSV